MEASMTGMWACDVVIALDRAAHAVALDERCRLALRRARDCARAAIHPSLELASDPERWLLVGVERPDRISAICARALAGERISAKELETAARPFTELSQRMLVDARMPSLG
jgi:hypothetical protein